MFLSSSFLLEETIVRWDPNMFIFGILIQAKVIRVTFFILLLDPFPPRESIFYVVWRTKKVRFFIWKLLLSRVNTVDKLV